MKLWRYGYSIERLGKRYRLEGSLGSGGMADVCLAWDEQEECEVAIKVIKSDDLDQETLDRFLAEAAHIARLDHPHILRVYDDLKWELLDVAHGSIVPYIVMEYAQKGDLQKRLIPGQPYPLSETLRIFAQLCSAVQHAHKCGIIHRDLKPLNILFRHLPDDSEQVVLSDFGLAVHVDATHHTFAKAGTLAYMAPEQFQGRSTPASDIFALGVILYQLCTGKLPFRHSRQDPHRIGPLETPPRPSTINPDLPKALDDVILAALSEDQAERFANAPLFWENVRVAVTPPIQKVPAVQPKENKAILPLPSLQPEKPIVDSSQATAGVVLAENSISQATGGTKEPATKLSQPLDVATDKLSQPISVRISTTPPAIPDGDGLFPLDASPGNRHSFRRPPARSIRRLFLALALVLLSLLLIFGSIALAAPGTLGAFGSSVSHVYSGGSPSATVTITPKSVDVLNTYVITGITTGTPDSTKRQVQARVLSSASQPESKTVSATGVVDTPGTRATGTLTFFNGSLAPYGVAAETVFTDAQGVQVANDVLAYIPAGNPNSGFGRVTVSAHAVNVGASGNIMAFDFNNVQCCGNSALAVSNTTAFTGGQDPQRYTAVQQSDVDGAATPLTQTAPSSLLGQKHANEQFVNRPQCTTTVTSNPPVGAKATSVTVTVIAKCSGEVYDQNAAQTIAANLLKSEAPTITGAGYALTGNVVTTVTKATVDSKGTVTLFVKAEGIWVYQFTTAYKMQLAKLIVGKSASQASALLLGQPGVGKVDGINIAGGSNTLPTDASQTTIVVQNVPGLKEARTGSPGSRTPTSTTSSPVARPSPSTVPGK